MKDFIRELNSYSGIGVKMLTYKREIKATKVNLGSSREVYFLHFEPPVKKHSEIVIYIHGGGWNSKSPRDFEFIGQRIAKEGYECIIMGYRKVPHVHFNQIINDICIEYKSVLRYLQGKNIDASRVIVMGSSAGAHLGSLLVYDKELHQKYRIGAKRFVGFIGLAGPYCFEGKLPWALKQLVSDLFEKDQEWSEGEPYSRIDLLTADDYEISIPMYLIQSDHDGVIDMEHTLVFARKAMEMNIPVTFYKVTDSKNTHTYYSTAVFFDDLSKSRTLQVIFNYLGQMSEK
ncbi:MAG: alpha/beta hydrolase [Lachnospiraceae bacterium]|nr:alpha/beta hydrolase [Lachnospiraceae bacterium]